MEKSPPLSVLIPMMFIGMLVIMVVTAVIVSLLRIRAGGHSRRGSLDNLIQFTSVQPDTPAFRAIIDLDTLTLCYGQWDHTNRTIHFLSPLMVV
jgi:hypothetical protein